MNKIFLGNLVDIQFSGDTFSVIKKHKITALSVEMEIKNERYIGQNLERDSKVEEANLPPFILMFFKYIIENNRIPKQEEFVDLYVYKFFNRIGNLCSLKTDYKTYYNCETPLTYSGLRARILRFYPSILRDFHFFLLCRDSGLFDKVVYSMAADYFEGYDLILYYKKKRFLVKMFTNTAKSQKYKDMKYSRHKTSSKDNEILLQMELGSKNGDFYLYTKENIDEIMKQIVSKETT